MTDKTKVVSIRLPNEVEAWLGADNRAREIIEDAYRNRRLDLTKFKRACDRLRIDYQLAIDRATEEINAIPMPSGMKKR